jgi:hypothetical protein
MITKILIRHLLLENAMNSMFNSIEKNFLIHKTITVADLNQSHVGSYIQLFDRTSKVLIVAGILETLHELKDRTNIDIKDRPGTWGFEKSTKVII